MNETPHQEKKRQHISETFNAEAALNQVKGPFVEIGGPSNDTWDEKKPFHKLLDTDQLSKKILATNVDPGVGVWEYDEDFEDYIQTGFMPAEMRVDATQMPFKNESIGALFGSALPIAIRENILQEAYRVLEPGGYIVWQYGNESDQEFCEKIGFQVVKDVPGIENIHDYIFKKV